MNSRTSADSESVVRLPHVLIPLKELKDKVAARSAALPHLVVNHVANLPPAATLKAYCPVAYNQARLGSCTANAICHYLKMLDPNRGKPGAFEPSRNFLYSCEQIMENPGQPLRDRGADAIDGCSIIRTIGICAESDYPYLVDPKTQEVTNALQIPTRKMYAAAAQHKVPIQVVDVTDNGSLLSTIQTLINQNTPVLMAFDVFAGLESEECLKTGILSMPTAAELSAMPLGGHEVLCVGYDTKYVHILNSWGTDWGQSGYFMMPVEYLSGRSARAGPMVDQLLSLGPIPIPQTPIPDPVPAPSPAPVLDIVQMRSQLAAAAAQLALVDSQLAAIQASLK